MEDIEKVIKGLENCSTTNGSCQWKEHPDCPYLESCKTEDYSALVRDALKLLKKQHGRWIEKEDYNLDTYYDCSVCGESWTTVEGTPWQNGMNYCPHCGAKMDFK